MLPVIYTPLTKTQMTWLSNQHGPCAALEMDLYRCGSRVGQIRMHVDCKKELNDFMECATQRKQFERYLAMQAERKRQKRCHTEAPKADASGVMY